MGTPSGLSVCLVALLAAGHAASEGEYFRNDCTVHFGGKNFYDLSEMVEEDGWYGGMQTVEMRHNTTFYFNVCDTLDMNFLPWSCSNIGSAYAVEYDGNEDQCTVIAKDEPLVYEKDWGLEVSFTHDGDYCTRLFKIEMQCVLWQGVNEPEEVEEEPQCVYQTEWPTSMACELTSTGSEKRNYLFFFFLVCSVVSIYMCLGTIYKMKQGYHGVNAVPHVETLRTIPVFCKDCARDIVKGKNGEKGSYEPVPSTTTINS